MDRVFMTSMESEIKEKIKSEYTFFKNSLLAFDWSMTSESIDESLKMFVIGSLLHRKGFLSNINTSQYKFQSINPYAFKFIQRFVATKMENSEDFDLTRTLVSSDLRKSTCVLEGAHLYWTKFATTQQGCQKVIRCQYYKPVKESNFRFMTLRQSQPVGKLFTVNMVCKKGRAYGGDADPQVFMTLTNRLTEITNIDNHLDLIKDNLETFRNECTIDENGVYSFDTVCKCLPKDFDFYKYNEYIVCIIVDLLNNVGVRDIKNKPWYIEVKKSQNVKTNSKYDKDLISRMFEDTDDENEDDDDDDDGGDDKFKASKKNEENDGDDDDDDDNDEDKDMNDDDGETATDDVEEWGL